MSRMRIISYERFREQRRSRMLMALRVALVVMVLGAIAGLILVPMVLSWPQGLVRP